MLVFTIAFLGVSYFLPKPTPAPTSTGGITITTDQTSVVMPNIPVIHITNDSGAPVTIDTCRDISIQKNLVAVSGLPDAFCQNLTIAPKAKTKLDISHLHRMFQGVGKYDFRLMQE